MLESPGPPSRSGQQPQPPSSAQRRHPAARRGNDLSCSPGPGGWACCAGALSRRLARPPAHHCACAPHSPFPLNSAQARLSPLRRREKQLAETQNRLNGDGRFRWVGVRLGGPRGTLRGRRYGWQEEGGWSEVLARRHPSRAAGPSVVARGLAVGVTPSAGRPDRGGLVSR